MLPLDSRQARIARRLLDSDGPTSVEGLASELALTARVVRYNLGSIDGVLRGSGLRLVRRRGLGIWIDGPQAARAVVRQSLDTDAGPSIVETDERRATVVVDLLDAAPDPVRLERLEASLAVSRATIRRDVRAIETWLEGHRLHLARIPGVGVAVRGNEVDVRGGMLGIVVESVPPHVLAERARMPSAAAPRAEQTPTGLDGFVASLDLPAFREVLEPELGGADDPGLLTATIAVAILARRVRAGHTAKLAGGRLRSLLDHPASETTARMASAITAATGLRLGQADVAAITESLLGLVELTGTHSVPGTRELRLVDRIVHLAADRLHPSLADDTQLRESLMEHLRRLRVRIRYGLPVSNPLQDEVRERYPEVYAVAADVLAAVGPIGGAATPPEEVGFLTMYLAGSLERHRLRPKIRVTVVCPAGMATAWILVSRLLAEFPQVEIVRVVSKAAFELDDKDLDTDLIVSTVRIEAADHAGRSLVVSPLLRERDVRRLSRVLGAPAH